MALSLGQQAEEIAAQYLLGKGYSILKRNHRTRLGEIDIVAQDGATFVFVEVKSGVESDAFLPREHFTPEKLGRVRRLAEAYLASVPGALEARIDLIEIIQCGPTFKIDHFESVNEDI